MNTLPSKFLVTFTQFEGIEGIRIIEGNGIIEGILKELKKFQKLTLSFLDDAKKSPNMTFKAYFLSQKPSEFF